MTRNTRYLLGILITIILGTLLYLNLCSDCIAGTSDSETIAAPEPVIEEVNAASGFPFSVTDGAYSYETQDNFNFKSSNSSFLLPITDNLKNGVANLKEYLLGDSKNVVDIVGLYKGSEANPSAYPNLGIARANSIKNYFTSQGIPSAQLNTLGKLMDDMEPTDDSVYLGAAQFEIHEKADDLEDKLKALYDKIKADPLVLYFNSGEAAINLTAEQRQKIADISYYLDKVDDANCSVIGHTDNTGRRATNVRLGQERADFAKAYLTQNGISETRIQTSSKGPDAPIAPNSTAEGRSKNRRTVVTLN